MKITANPFKANKYKLIQRVAISPELAAYLIQNYNRDNPRKDRKGNRNEIAYSLEHDHWDAETGVLLIFELGTGCVLDGQHRLMAIANQKKTVFTGVAVGVKRNRYSGWQGLARTMGEQNAVALNRGRDNAKHDGKVLRMAWTILRNEHPENRGLRWDSETLWNYYVTHQKAFDFALRAGSNTRGRSLGVRAAIAHTLHNTNFDTKVQTFFDELVSSEGMVKSNSVRKLREWLDVRNFKDGKRSTDDDYLKTLTHLSLIN